VLPKSHHLAGRATTPSPVVCEPARAEKAYRTTAVKKKSRFRTNPVNTGYYLDIWVGIRAPTAAMETTRVKSRRFHANPTVSG
jgi:hypothetical protein